MAVGIAEFNTYMGISITISIVSVLAPAFRFYILRRRRHNRVSLCADLFFCFAWFLSIAVGIQETLFTFKERSIRLRAQNELEVDLELVTTEFLQFGFEDQIVQATKMWLVKAAFLCFYWQPTTDGHRPTGAVRFSLYATAVSLAVTYVTILVLFLVYCKPISLNWNVDDVLLGHYCTPDFAFMPQTLVVVATVVTDLMVLGIPLLLIASIKQRLSVIERRVLPLIFLIGSLTLVPPIVRYSVNYAAGLYSKGSKQGKPLTMQQFHVVVILSKLETMCGIIAFSLPAFRFVLSSAFWKKRKNRLAAGLPLSRKPKKSATSDTELLRSHGTAFHEESTPHESQLERGSTTSEIELGSRVDGLAVISLDENKEV